jgi:hypothetical protein
MLMKEALKLGADDIVNLRIDEKVTSSVNTSTAARVFDDNTRNTRSANIKTKDVVYTANALAIKYIQKD